MTEISQITTDKDLTPTERLIGVHVLFAGGSLNPVGLQEELGIADKKIRESLRLLVAKGYIVRNGRFGGWSLPEEANGEKNRSETSNGEKDQTNGEFHQMNGEKDQTNGEIRLFAKPPQEETESEKESKKERSKERSKEKEREKEEGVRDIGNPYGLPLSETIVSDAESVPDHNSLGDSDLFQVTEQYEVKQCPYQAIQNMFNRICVSYRKIKGIDGKRRQLVSGRWTSYPDLEVFRQVFENAENSSFMKGQGRNGWTADFDWMMKPSNFQKVLEGNYNDRPQGVAANPQQSGDPFLAYMRAVANGEA